MEQLDEVTEELAWATAYFHEVRENRRTDASVITPETMELLKAHLKALKGKVG